MSDGPILVISDTHFGFEDESAERFARFMTYLTDSVQSGQLIIKKPSNQYGKAAGTTLSEESLEAPQKIILLGDILDLWISRDSNTVRPYKEGFGILNSLIALNREIVWLIGNHDAPMQNYAGTHTVPSRAGFSVFCGGYPNDNGPDGGCKKEFSGGRGERVGGRKYYFLHGHQFDFFFRHGSVLRFGNFVGFSSATARDFKRFKWLGGIVFLLSAFVVLSPLLNNWLPPLLTSIAPFEKNSMLAALTLFIWWLVGAIAFLGVLWLFTWLARWYYNYSHHPGHTPNDTNKTDPSSKKTIQQRIGCYDFKRVERSIDADVIVCGHTHKPYIKTYTSSDGEKRLLVNSGSWIEQRENLHDTFVHIDKKGLRVLKWHDDNASVSQIMSSLL
ncbi:MAG: metallophosphoesterase [Halobacteriota archaeon]